MQNEKFNIQFSELKGIYLQPAFLVCVVVLVIAGSAMSFAIKKFGVILEKEPAPLKKSLELLSEDDLAPYKIVEKIEIKNKEIIKSLGTDQYIQWALEDASVAEDSPVRRFSLFITYYDLPGQVLHVPEECYQGGGYQQLASESASLNINKSGVQEKIPANYLVYNMTSKGFFGKSKKFSILYLFRVNDVYVNGRESARATLNKNIFGKYSYFCKVELTFNQALVMPDKKTAMTASEKILSVVLPVLETEHWPDLKKLNQDLVSGN